MPQPCRNPAAAGGPDWVPKCRECGVSRCRVRDWQRIFGREARAGGKIAPPRQCRQNCATRGDIGAAAAGIEPYLNI